MSGRYIRLFQNTTKEFEQTRTETMPFSYASPTSKREMTVSMQGMMYDEWHTVWRAD